MVNNIILIYNEHYKLEQNMYLVAKDKYQNIIYNHKVNTILYILQISITLESREQSFPA